MGLLGAAVTVATLSVLKLIQEKIADCRKKSRNDAEVQTSENLDDPVPV